MKEEKCRYCGKVLNKEECHEFDGKVMCKACLDEMTSICAHCGERLWNDENSGTGDFVLCQRCYDNHYTTCERCGHIIHYDAALYFDDEDYPYCGSCYDVLTKNEIIHDYNYKPEPIFYGKDNMYLGVELEIERGGESSDNAQRILDVANSQAEHMYIKHDGSIEDGFEMVTHPMSLDYHKSEMPWQKMKDFQNHMKAQYRTESACLKKCVSVSPMT